MDSRKHCDAQGKPLVFLSLETVMNKFRWPALAIGFCASFSFADTQTGVYLEAPYQSKAGQVPACTALVVKEGKRKVTLRDANKSWPKTKIDAEAYSSHKTHTDLNACLNAVTAYEGRFDHTQVSNLMLGNLTPGMPSEFAFMLLGAASNRSMSSYMDPVTGTNKTYTYYVWNNSKRMGAFGAALSVAGAATGLGGVIGSVGAVQAGAVAMTAASTAYSVESLKAYKVVTIGVDESGTIQSFSAN